MVEWAVKELDFSKHFSFFCFCFLFVCLLLFGCCCFFNMKKKIKLNISNKDFVLKCPFDFCLYVCLFLTELCSGD